MNAKAICKICHEEVPASEQETHLAQEHPPKDSRGFRFYVDGAEHFAEKPSMLIAQLKQLVGGGFGYRTIVNYNGSPDDHHLSDGEAIDLTNSPMVFFVPPARM